MERDICALVEKEYAFMVETRRHLHRHPEPSGQEEQTALFVAGQLQAKGIECRRLPQHGVIGRIYGSRPGKVLALRADMDALQMQETAQVPYCSQRPGVMHSCGHDGHTAALLGAAGILAQLREDFCGEVRLLFQPSEENCQGARSMIQAGALENVESIFGMHVDLGQPAGRFDISTGVRTCAADRFILCFSGRPLREGSQAIRAAAAAVLALQTLASREVSPKTVFAFSCCRIAGGMNEKDDRVTVEGTCRYSDEALCGALAEKIRRIAQNTAAPYGVSAELKLEHIAYPLVNQPHPSRIACESAAQLFGNQCLAQSGADSVSEDFAEYLQVVEGCYGKLGANHSDMRLSCPNHNPGFDMNERALYYGAALFVQYALNVLSSPLGLEGRKRQREEEK